MRGQVYLAPAFIGRPAYPLPGLQEAGSAGMVDLQFSKDCVYF